MVERSSLCFFSTICRLPIYSDLPGRSTEHWNNLDGCLCMGSAKLNTFMICEFFRYHEILLRFASYTDATLSKKTRRPASCLSNTHLFDRIATMQLDYHRSATSLEPCSTQVGSMITISLSTYLVAVVNVSELRA